MIYRTDTRFALTDPDQIFSESTLQLYNNGVVGNYGGVLETTR